MDVTVHNKPQQILLSTISLVKNNKQPDNIYLFHCYNCANPLHKIQGDVDSIDAGLIPSNNIVVITHCYKCKKNYTFQTTIGKVGKIELTLSYDTDQQAFHCIICRSPLLRYNQDYAVILPQTIKTILPFNFDCINKECNKKYQLNEIVYS